MRKEKPKSAIEAAQATRGYVHFDAPLSPSACEKLVSDPEAVRRHSFLPFIRHDIIRAKLKRVGPGQVKKSRKIRDIRYASHADSAIYAYYNFQLMERYERSLKTQNLVDNVIAFRPLGRSNIDFAHEAFSWIKSNEPCVAFGFDVVDFFGSLDHGLLKQRWTSLIGATRLPDDHFAVFRALTKHASVELIAAREALGLSRSRLEQIKRLCGPADFRRKIRDAGLVHVNPHAHGIPQGSPISAALSNIYMTPFDATLKAEVESRGGLYRRYCDDILVIVPKAEAKVVEPLVAAELASLKLTVQPAKTLVCQFDSGASDVPLQYLGLIFDGTRTTLRPAGITRFYLKMRKGVRQLKSAKRTDGGTPLAIQRRRLLLNRYTEHGPEHVRSYFRYVKRAAATTTSPEILRQLRGHRRRIKEILDE